MLVDRCSYIILVATILQKNSKLVNLFIFFINKALYLVIVIIWFFEILVFNKLYINNILFQSWLAQFLWSRLSN